MDVSVIIPTYNRSTQLTATLDSLLGCDTAGLEQVEIIVVDDGSPHPVAPLVESRGPGPPANLAAHHPSKELGTGCGPQHRISGLAVRSSSSSMMISCVRRTSSAGI